MTNAGQYKSDIADIISQDREASWIRLFSIPLKRVNMTMQHTLRQLDVVLTLEVSAACVRACIFWVKRKIPVTPWGAKMNLWNLLYIKHVNETPSKHTSNPQPKQRYIDDTSLEQQTVLEFWWIASTLSSRSQALNTASPLKDPRRSTLETTSHASSYIPMAEQGPNHWVMPSEAFNISFTATGMTNLH
jgi:hypothetical protein